jgi:hypothetical protein
MGRVFSRCGGEKRCIRDFGVETCENEQLGTPRRTWEDNIKIDLYEVECGDTEWIDLV